MYYKIVTNGEIVDVCEEIAFVRWQEKNRKWIICAEKFAEGILSSYGDRIYRLVEAEYAEISAEEYARLRAEIDAGRSVPDESGTDDGEEGERAMTRLEQLELLVKALEAQNQALTDCLLEMSEIVYS